MYKLLCSNITKSHKSLTNFTRYYRKVAQKYDRGISSSKKYVSETDLQKKQTVEENTEPMECTEEILDTEIPPDKESKSFTSFFTRKIGKTHLCRPESCTEQQIVATTCIPARYFHSTEVNNKESDPSLKKGFKSKEAEEYYQSAIEQCMLIKQKLDKHYQQASWDARPPKLISELKKELAHIQMSKSKEKSMATEQEARIPIPELKQVDVIKTAKPNYQFKPTNIRIKYPTHTIRYKLGTYKLQHSIKQHKLDHQMDRQMPGKEAASASFQTMKVKHQKASEQDKVKINQIKFKAHQRRLPIIASLLQQTPSELNSEETKQQQKLDEAVIKHHPTVRRANTSVKMAYKSRYNQLLQKSGLMYKQPKKEDVPTPQDHVAKDADSQEKGEVKTPAATSTESAPSSKSIYEVYYKSSEPQEPVTEPKVIQHPMASSNQETIDPPANYPKRILSEKSETFDIEATCIKTNSTNTASRNLGDYIVESDEKVKNFVEGHKQELQDELKQIVLAEKDLRVKGESKINTDKGVTPVDCIGEYLKKLKVLRDQTAVDRVNLRKPEPPKKLDMVQKVEGKKIQDTVRRLEERIEAASTNIEMLKADEQKEVKFKVPIPTDRKDVKKKQYPIVDNKNADLFVSRMENTAKDKVMRRIKPKEEKMRSQSITNFRQGKSPLRWPASLKPVQSENLSKMIKRSEERNPFRSNKASEVRDVTDERMKTLDTLKKIMEQYQVTSRSGKMSVAEANRMNRKKMREEERRAMEELEVQQKKMDQEEMEEEAKEAQNTNANLPARYEYAFGAQQISPNDENLSKTAEEVTTEEKEKQVFAGNLEKIVIEMLQKEKEKRVLEENLQEDVSEVVDVKTEQASKEMADGVQGENLEKSAGKPLEDKQIQEERARKATSTMPELREKYVPEKELKNIATSALEVKNEEKKLGYQEKSLPESAVQIEEKVKQILKGKAESAASKILKESKNESKQGIGKLNKVPEENLRKDSEKVAKSLAETYPKFEGGHYMRKQVKLIENSADSKVLKEKSEVKAQHSMKDNKIDKKAASYKVLEKEKQCRYGLSRFQFENLTKLKEASKNIVKLVETIDELKPVDKVEKETERSTRNDEGETKKYKLDEKNEKSTAPDNRPTIRKEKPEPNRKDKEKKEQPKSKTDIVLPSKGQNDPKLQHNQSGFARFEDPRRDIIEEINEKLSKTVPQDYQSVPDKQMKKCKSLADLANEQKATILKEIEAKWNEENTEPKENKPFTKDEAKLSLQATKKELEKELGVAALDINKRKYAKEYGLNKEVLEKKPSNSEDAAMFSDVARPEDSKEKWDGKKKSPKLIIKLKFSRPSTLPRSDDDKINESEREGQLSREISKHLKNKEPENSTDNSPFDKKPQNLEVTMNKVEGRPTAIEYQEPNTRGATQTSNLGQSDRRDGYCSSLCFAKVKKLRLEDDILNIDLTLPKTGYASEDGRWHTQKDLDLCFSNRKRARIEEESPSIYAKSEQVNIEGNVHRMSFDAPSSPRSARRPRNSDQTDEAENQENTCLCFGRFRRGKIEDDAQTTESISKHFISTSTVQGKDSWSLAKAIGQSGKIGQEIVQKVKTQLGHLHARVESPSKGALIRKDERAIWERPREISEADIMHMKSKKFKTGMKKKHVKNASKTELNQKQPIERPKTTSMLTARKQPNKHELERMSVPNKKLTSIDDKTGRIDFKSRTSKGKKWKLEPVPKNSEKELEEVLKTYEVLRKPGKKNILKPGKDSYAKPKKISDVKDKDVKKTKYNKIYHNKSDSKTYIVLDSNKRSKKNDEAGQNDTKWPSGTTSKFLVNGKLRKVCKTPQRKVSPTVSAAKLANKPKTGKSDRSLKALSSGNIQKPTKKGPRLSRKGLRERNRNQCKKQTKPDNQNNKNDMNENNCNITKMSKDISHTSQKEIIPVPVVKNEPKTKEKLPPKMELKMKEDKHLSTSTNKNQSKLDDKKLDNKTAWATNLTEHENKKALEKHDATKLDVVENKTVQNTDKKTRNEVADTKLLLQLSTNNGKEQLGNKIVVTSSNNVQEKADTTPPGKPEDAKEKEKNTVEIPGKRKTNVTVTTAPQQQVSMSKDIPNDIIKPEPRFFEPKEKKVRFGDIDLEPLRKLQLSETKKAETSKKFITSSNYCNKSRKGDSKVTRSKKKASFKISRSTLVDMFINPKKIAPKKRKEKAVRTIFVSPTDDNSDINLDLGEGIKQEKNKGKSKPRTPRKNKRKNLLKATTRDGRQRKTPSPTNDTRNLSMKKALDAHTSTPITRFDVSLKRSGDELKVLQLPPPPSNSVSSIDRSNYLLETQLEVLKSANLPQHSRSVQTISRWKHFLEMESEALRATTLPELDTFEVTSEGLKNVTENSSANKHELSDIRYGSIGASIADIKTFTLLEETLTKQLTKMLAQEKSKYDSQEEDAVKKWEPNEKNAPAKTNALIKIELNQNGGDLKSESEEKTQNLSETKENKDFNEIISKHAEEKSLKLDNKHLNNAYKKVTQILSIVNDENLALRQKIAVDRDVAILEQKYQQIQGQKLTQIEPSENTNLENKNEKLQSVNLKNKITEINKNKGQNIEEQKLVKPRSNGDLENLKKQTVEVVNKKLDELNKNLENTSSLADNLGSRESKESAKQERHFVTNQCQFERNTEGQTSIMNRNPTSNSKLDSMSSKSERGEEIGRLREKTSQIINQKLAELNKNFEKMSYLVTKLSSKDITATMNQSGSCRGDLKVQSLPHGLSIAQRQNCVERNTESQNSTATQSTTDTRKVAIKHDSQTEMLKEKIEQVINQKLFDLNKNFKSISFLVERLKSNERKETLQQSFSNEELNRNQTKMDANQNKNTKTDTTIKAQHSTEYEYYRDTRNKSDLVVRNFENREELEQLRERTMQIINKKLDELSKNFENVSALVKKLSLEEEKENINHGVHLKVEKHLLSNVEDKTGGQKCTTRNQGPTDVGIKSYFMLNKMRNKGGPGKLKNMEPVTTLNKKLDKLNRNFEKMTSLADELKMQNFIRNRLSDKQTQSNVELGTRYSVGNILENQSDDKKLTSSTAPCLRNFNKNTLSNKSKSEEKSKCKHISQKVCQSLMTKNPNDIEKTVTESKKRMRETPLEDPMKKCLHLQKKQKTSAETTEHKYARQSKSYAQLEAKKSCIRAANNFSKTNMVKSGNSEQNTSKTGDKMVLVIKEVTEDRREKSFEGKETTKDKKGCMTDAKEVESNYEASTNAADPFRVPSENVMGKEKLKKVFAHYLSNREYFRKIYSTNKRDDSETMALHRVGNEVVSSQNKGDDRDLPEAIEPPTSQQDAPKLLAAPQCKANEYVCHKVSVLYQNKDKEKCLLKLVESSPNKDERNLPSNIPKQLAPEQSKYNEENLAKPPGNDHKIGDFSKPPQPHQNLEDIGTVCQSEAQKMYQVTDQEDSKKVSRSIKETSDTNEDRAIVQRDIVKIHCIDKPKCNMIPSNFAENRITTVSLDKMTYDEFHDSEKGTVKARIEKIFKNHHKQEEKIYRFNKYLLRHLQQLYGDVPRTFKNHNAIIPSKASLDSNKKQKMLKVLKMELKKPYYQRSTGFSLLKKYNECNAIAHYSKDKEEDLPTDQPKKEEEPKKARTFYIEKSLPNPYRDKKTELPPKPVTRSCERLCLPLKSPSQVAFKQPIEEMTTLQKDHTEKILMVPKTVPSIRDKYKGLKITNIHIKRPTRKPEESFLPTIVLMKASKDPEGAQTMKSLEESRKKILEFRYELLRQLNKEFNDISGDPKKNVGNFERISKYYKSVTDKLKSETKDEIVVTTPAKPIDEELGPCPRPSFDRISRYYNLVLRKKDTGKDEDAAGANEGLTRTETLLRNLSETEDKDRDTKQGEHTLTKSVTEDNTEGTEPENSGK